MTSGNWASRRLRHISCGVIAILAALVGQLGVSGVMPAAAYDDCTWVGNSSGTNGSDWTCDYTQLGGSNNDWPGLVDQGAGTFPRCYDNNGNYCNWWPSPNGQPDNVPYLNTLSNDNRASFYDDARTAIGDWSGQPFNSPIFYDCHNNNTCNKVSVTFKWADLGNTGTCASGGPSTMSGDTIVTAAVTLNSNSSVSWSDGYNNWGACDAQSTLYHEVGHVFAEGHSSNSNDVMYWRDCMCTTIDKDAQSVLNAVYGKPSTDSSDSMACSCEYLACPQVPAVTTANGVPTVNQTLWTVCGTGYALPYVWNYYAKAWNLAQGQAVPSASDVEQLAFPPPCTLYFTSKQLVLWLECVAPLK